jgi:hypothetical protein
MNKGMGSVFRPATAAAQNAANKILMYISIILLICALTPAPSRQPYTATAAPIPVDSQSGLHKPQSIGTAMPAEKSTRATTSIGESMKHLFVRIFCDITQPE